MLNIKKELLVFFCACLTGECPGLYKILIFLRKMIIHNKSGIERIEEDLFYWIFNRAYIFFVQIYATTYGSIRWYFLLGLGLGSCRYSETDFCLEKKYTKKQGKTLKLLADRMLIIGKFKGNQRQ